MHFILIILLNLGLTLQQGKYMNLINLTVFSQIYFVEYGK